MAFLRVEIINLTTQLGNARCTEAEMAVGNELLDKEQQLNALILFDDINKPTDGNY